MRRIPDRPLTDAEQRLIGDNWPLVGKAAANYARNDLDVDDLRQEAAARLCHMICRFDPSRGRWSTFVYIVVRTVASQMRQKPYAGRRIPPTRLLPLEYPDGQPFDPMGDADVALPDEPAPDVTRALGQLEPRYRDVVRRRFGLGREPQTLTQVAADIRRSKQRVQQIQTRALQRIRRIIGETASR